MKQIELINEYVMNNSKVNDVLRALQKGEMEYKPLIFKQLLVFYVIMPVVF